MQRSYLTDATSNLHVPVIVESIMLEMLHACIVSAAGRALLPPRLCGQMSAGAVSMLRHSFSTAILFVTHFFESIDLVDTMRPHRPSALGSIVHSRTAIRRAAIRRAATDDTAADADEEEND